MKDAPAISVVTVCRNAESTIARTAQSLVDQTCWDFEWVVVDGQSTDGTLAVAESCAARLRDSGIAAECRSEPDRGIYDAMNKGITRSRGDIIGILNSDDYYETETIAHIRAAHASYPEVDIFYGFLRHVRAGSEFCVIRHNYDYTLTHLGHAAESGAEHPTCFVLKTVYDRIGMFDIQYPTAADYDFLLRAKRHGMRFLALDHILSNFSLGGASAWRSNVNGFGQRWRAQYANGLMTAAEYRQKQRLLARMRLAEWRQSAISRILKWGGA
jgi:glycosyltransferase involved in cell wall biosynthesis